MGNIDGFCRVDSPLQISSMFPIKNLSTFRVMDQNVQPYPLDSLKQYFQDRSQQLQSGVFKSANTLSQQTNTLLMNMTNIVFD